MKLYESTKQIHEYAKAKGWWESPRTTDEIYMLFVSELAEATEEVRNKKPALYYVRGTQNVECLDISMFPEGEKPEGESVELADAFIRTLDFAGSYDMDLNNNFPGLKEGYDIELNDIVGLFDENLEYNYYEHFSPLDAHFDMVKVLSVAPIIDSTLAHFIIKIARYFKHKGWNLNDVVALKVAYNQKRPYRHGGKAY